MPSPLAPAPLPSWLARGPGAAGPPHRGGRPGAARHAAGPPSRPAPRRLVRRVALPGALHRAGRLPGDAAAAHLGDHAGTGRLRARDCAPRASPRWPARTWAASRTWSRAWAASRSWTGRARRAGCGRRWPARRRPPRCHALVGTVSGVTARSRCCGRRTENAARRGAARGRGRAGAERRGALEVELDAGHPQRRSRHQLEADVGRRLHLAAAAAPPSGAGQPFIFAVRPASSSRRNSTSVHTARWRSVRNRSWFIQFTRRSSQPSAASSTHVLGRGLAVRVGHLGPRQRPGRQSEQIRRPSGHATRRSRRWRGGGTRPIRTGCGVAPSRRPPSGVSDVTSLLSVVPARSGSIGAGRLPESHGHELPAASLEHVGTSAGRARHRQRAVRQPPRVRKDQRCGSTADRRQ